MFWKKQKPVDEVASELAAILRIQGKQMRAGRTNGVMDYALAVRLKSAQRSFDALEGLATDWDRVDGHPVRYMIAQRPDLMGTVGSKLKSAEEVSLLSAIINGD